MLQTPAGKLARLRRLALAFTLPVALGQAATEKPLPEQARATLAKATAYMRSISAEGGYLWRYSPDLKSRAGENDATPTQIWIQPPGTPSMGMAFLRAYEVTKDAQYLDAARAAANALAVGQLESGGWDYLIDFDPQKSRNWYRRSDAGRIAPADAAKRKNISTYDDDNTQSALRFLLAYGDVTKDSKDPADGRIREARDYGLQKLLAAQRPNGGWPQRWDGVPIDPREYPVQPARFPKEYPREYPKQNYMGYYTLNDNTHRDCVMTLFDAAKRLGKPEYRAAAIRGGDFLIMAQLPEPQPAWAQQYNPQLEPAWARAFEPPSVCSGESVGVMRLLVDLYLETGDKKYLEPLPRAIAWFKRSAIAPGLWARMYEIGTNTPIYGDRDGKIKYRVEDLSPERQTGYSWKSNYGVDAAIAYYEEVVAKGRDAMRAKSKPGRAGPRRSRDASGSGDLELQVRQVIAGLDAQGRWLAPGGRRSPEPQITTGAFIANVNLLCAYLERAK